MGRTTRGCGCAVAVLLLVIAAAGVVTWKLVLPWLRTQPPPASGGELTVRVLDVGPVNGDAILISAPSGKTVLIDAGDTNRGKAVVEALKRNNVQQLDYFIATHPHPDHIGGSAEVFKAVKVLNVIDNGQGPNLPSVPSAKSVSKKTAARNSPSLSKFYDDYKAAVSASGANYATATPGVKYDLGGGALLTVIAPSEPLFTREHMRTGGNEPNANSIMLRLDYGSFSMMLAGDAEEQTEHRLITKELDLETRVLKVGHHGSRYATSEGFLKRVKPEIAIVSCGAWNRYGHPSQAVLDRLRAANVKLYRTDLHGEITITTRGAANDISVKSAKEPTEDAWAGRTAQKDDSTRSGFIAYGDFGPPPRPRKSEQK
ncbi:MAG TPA: ComEC/Rec2 family competence protein [Pyrinomonadaceae bacterium]|nr:ComEC/Rec2 family competence protein [Pyrinomonadaceae bacterium]